LPKTTLYHNNLTHLSHMFHSLQNSNSITHVYSLAIYLVIATASCVKCGLSKRTLSDRYRECIEVVNWGACFEGKRWGKGFFPIHSYYVGIVLWDSSRTFFIWKILKWTNLKKQIWLFCVIIVCFVVKDYILFLWCCRCQSHLILFVDVIIKLLLMMLIKWRC
jgi:hypothetical protein